MKATSSDTRAVGSVVIVSLRIRHQIGLNQNRVFVLVAAKMLVVEAAGIDDARLVEGRVASGREPLRYRRIPFGWRGRHRPAR